MCSYNSILTKQKHQIHARSQKSGSKLLAPTVPVFNTHSPLLVSPPWPPTQVLILYLIISVPQSPHLSRQCLNRTRNYIPNFCPAAGNKNESKSELNLANCN